MFLLPSKFKENWLKNACKLLRFSKVEKKRKRKKNMKNITPILKAHISMMAEQI